MKFALAIVGTVALLGVVLAAARLLLPACGISTGGITGWLFHCPDPVVVARKERIESLAFANRALLARVASAERRLALRQCTMQERATPPPVIDTDAWEERDIGLLEGCWALDSRFSTRDRETGQQTRYTTWEMCFDDAGNGTEEMRADNGNICRGPVRGTFDGAGRLFIEEPDDLQCSDGGFIYRLQSRCTLRADGTASCAVTQPEPGSSTTVDFRRATGSN